MALIRAQRDRGATCTAEADGGVGVAELWDAADAVEEVDEVGDAGRDDIGTSDSWVRCTWLSRVLRTASVISGWAKPRRMVTCLPSTSGWPSMSGLYA
jgi:hypothetical protein